MASSSPVKASLTIKDVTIDNANDATGIGKLKKLLVDLSTSEPPAYGEALRTLADAARAPEWRVVVGDGILAFVLQRFDVEKNSTLVSLQGLRLVGNCCIDNGSLLSTPLALQFFDSFQMTIALLRKITWTE